jgi:hypothetical protein
VGPPVDDETYQQAFERIESAVDAGTADLGALGFWRLVAAIKAEPALSRHWADVAGRIDRKAFEARVRPRFPVWLGNAALLGGAGLGGAAAGLAIATSSQVTAGLALLVAAGAWSVAWHDLAHWVVGRAVGIRFTAYFIGGPFPPRPGLKIDYATYVRADPIARAWMHASGAIVTKLAPFVALAFWPATDAPAWVALGLAALGAFQIATDLAFSTRSGEWRRVRRELAVARARAADR